MFGIRCNRANIKRRITIVLALMAIMMCTTDVQLYCEQRILANAAACADKFNQHENYFNMSLSELMNVVIVSKLGGEPSFVLDSCS